MHSKKLALSVASLTLVLSFLACSFPGSGGGTPTPVISETTEPAGPALSAPPAGVPTNTDGAETVVIPGGRFRMGSDDAAADEDQKPGHEVILDTFPIYAHAVTNEMYVRCVEAGACTPIQVLEGGPTSHTDDPAFADDPVVGVDWNMADDYCTWASGRLPTEAEWEYATGSDKGLTYLWGKETPASDRVSMVGLQSTTGVVPIGWHALSTRPDQARALAGDAWEWTYDWYDPDYYAFSPSDSPIGPNLPEDPEEPQKVVRGAGRTGGNPLRAYDDVGFRCVAQPALDLPDDYAVLPDGHEFVPPDSGGDGESVEDADDPPAWVVMLSPGDFTCPDPDGRVHLTLNASSSVDPTAFSVSVEGSALDCSYDPEARQLSCSGLPPAAYEAWGDHAPIQVCFEHAYGGRCTDLNATKPTGCPGEGMRPLELTASIGCPEDDWVTVTFTYNLRMTWHYVRVQEGGLYQGMFCYALSPTSLECRAQARAPGAIYFFGLQGRDADGWTHHHTLSAAIPADCLPYTRTLEVRAVCSEREPVVLLHFAPVFPRPSRVFAPGVPLLSCINVSAGGQLCRPLPGDAGSTTTVTTCFPGEECQEWPLTVPDCPGDVSRPTVEVVPMCKIGFPGVLVSRTPPSSLPLLVHQAIGDFTYGFGEAPGVISCIALHGDVGSTTTVATCYRGEPCQEWEVTVPDCEEEVLSEGKFALAGVGCHDEKHIFFILDTRMTWLVPGAAFTYTADDGVTSYSCSVHPTIAGRLYCSGSRPGSPGALEVCVRQDGTPSPICRTFADWPARENTIPSCVPTPTSPAVDACSAWTDYTECEKNHPPCRWDYGTSTCHSP